MPFVHHDDDDNGDDDDNNNDDDNDDDNGNDDDEFDNGRNTGEDSGFGHENTLSCYVTLDVTYMSLTHRLISFLGGGDGEVSFALNGKEQFRSASLKRPTCETSRPSTLHDRQLSRFLSHQSPLSPV